MGANRLRPPAGSRCPSRTVAFTAALTAALLAVAAAAARAAEPPAANPERKTITIAGQMMQLRTSDEVRALGLPWIDVADADNAATYYIRGANALYKIEQDRKHDVPPEQGEHVKTNRWDPKLRELSALLDAAKPALDLFREGSRKELCQLPYSHSRMLAGMLLPSLTYSRKACRLLAQEARRFESRKEFGKAVDNYLACVRIGAHYGRGRTLIDDLVGIADISIATDHAFYGILRHEYPKKELERVGGGLAALSDRLPDYTYAMKCERAFGLGTVDDLMRDVAQGGDMRMLMGMWGGGEAPAPEGGSPLLGRFVRILLPDRTIRSDLAGVYDRMIAAAKTPYYKPEARNAADRALAKCKPWNVLASMLLPALSRVRTSSEKCHARVDLLRLSIALQLYRHSFGVWPDRLDWLVKEKLVERVPADPFSGKAYRYKVTDGHFVVYSVGDDLEDNGGDLKQPVSFGQRDADYGFTSKLPADGKK